MTARPRPNRRVPVPTQVYARPAHAQENHGFRDDPIHLAATVRDLAARAHRAVRALDPASGRADGAATAIEPLRELADLHPRIVELQRSVDGASQRDLASYLSALRREVESRLG